MALITSDFAHNAGERHLAAESGDGGGADGAPAPPPAILLLQTLFGYDIWGNLDGLQVTRWPHSCHTAATQLPHSSAAPHEKAAVFDRMTAEARGKAVFLCLHKTTCRIPLQKANRDTCCLRSCATARRLTLPTFRLASCSTVTTAT